MPIGGKSWMELNQPAQTECIRVSKPLLEELRDILDCISTPEKRTNEFLRSYYGWKSSLFDRADEFREIAVTYRDSRQLVYRYVSLVQDVSIALTQLRAAITTAADQYKVDAQCAMLRTCYVRLVDMTENGNVFERSEK